jgi:hypothetical protein
VFAEGEGGVNQRVVERTLGSLFGQPLKVHELHVGQESEDGWRYVTVVFSKDDDSPRFVLSSWMKPDPRARDGFWVSESSVSPSDGSANI